MNNEKENTLENKTIHALSKKRRIISNLITLIFVLPILFVGIAFAGVGIYCSILEYKETKGYEKTTGILKKYINCNYDGSEQCEAIYEYQVNEITYSVSPKLISNRDGFETTSIIYYNPNNPSEAVMGAKWGTLAISGFIIILFVIVIFILKIKMRKVLKVGNNIVINVHK